MDEELYGPDADIEDVITAFMNEEVDEDTLSAGDEGDEDTDGDEPEVDQDDTTDEGGEGDDKRRNAFIGNKKAVDGAD